MLKLFKDNLKTTNDCIILATPLIIFVSILWFYIQYAINAVDNNVKIMLSIVTATVMFAGFLSAWLYMVKKTMELSKKTFIFDIDRIKSLWYLTSTLPKGIGRLFIPILISTILSIIIIIGIYYMVSNWIELQFGTLQLNPDILYALLAGNKDYLLEATESLSINDISAIYLLYIVLNFCTALFAFFTLLWIPEIVYNQRNAFKALISSYKKMIIGMPETILLFFYILMLTLFMKYICLLTLINNYLYFLVLIIFYYYIVYIVVLLFSYYERNFTEN
ncbi:MAG: hypothetical protein E7Z87_04370 [Cyanobacteria bacterium SIG26]|nr:hypothetical protein [Cyanobacteria bacterium SIG26]